MVNEIERSDLNDSFETWYDDQFSIKGFRNSLVTVNEKTNLIMETVADIISDKNQDCEVSEKYVVNISDETKDLIDKGVVKLDTNKQGEVFAQVKNSNGKYGEKLSIRKELEEKGLSAKEVEIAMQMKAIQDVLVKIVEILDDIGEHVNDILIGQQNDRIGLYYSGMNLFLESNSIQDETLKKYLVAQAIRALNDSNAQMIQQIRSDIQYLSSGKYNHLKSVRKDKIDEKISSITNCYDIVYRSSFLKAAIYNSVGEFNAMLTTCEEYGKFIEKLILPNNLILTEADKNDKKLDITIWEERAKVLLKCNDVKNILDSKVFYIGYVEDVDNER